MPTWPSSLPDSFLRDGLSESPPDLLVRTKMDQGPDKVRRWGTANVRPIAGQQRMELTQVGILDTFYNDTLEGGALKFDWTHPRTEASVEFRFTAPPTYQPLKGNKWRTQIQLEVMP
jgi:hypothetical protein